jgi:hypothetical protein
MGQTNSRESQPLLAQASHPSDCAPGSDPVDPKQAMMECRQWTVNVVLLPAVPVIDELQALCGEQLLVTTKRSQLLLELPLDTDADGKFCRLSAHAGHQPRSLQGHAAVDTHEQKVWTLGSTLYKNTKAIAVPISRYCECDLMSLQYAPASSSDPRYFHFSRLACNQRGDLACFNARMNRIDCFFKQCDFGFSLFFGTDSVIHENSSRAEAVKPTNAAESHRIVTHLSVTMNNVYALDGVTNTLWVWTTPQGKNKARYQNMLRLDAAQQDLSVAITDSGNILVYTPALCQLDAYSAMLEHTATLFSGLTMPDGEALPTDCRLVVDHLLRIWLYSPTPTKPGHSARLLQISPYSTHSRKFVFQPGVSPFHLQAFPAASVKV